MSQREDIIPNYYYQELVRMGKENLCEGKIVEGMGYCLPQVVVTPEPLNDYETFYNVDINTHLAVAAMGSSENKPDTIPFFILESRHKSVYYHHVRAITMRGKPSYLTYDSDDKKRSKRRREATGHLPTIDDLQKDEYPYATTLEGGLGASVEYVPSDDNSRHGGDLGAVRRAFRMQTGDVFQIILVPQSDQWQPESQPVFIPAALREGIRFPHPNPVPAKTIVTWGAVVAAMAAMGKTLDVVFSRYFFIFMPLDPTIYQNQQQINNNGSTPVY